MTASTSIIICLTQFETILFFFFKTPPQRYKDTRLIIYIQQNRTRMIPPSWLNMMHMSHIIPSFISSILLLHIIRIWSTLYFYFYFGGKGGSIERQQQPWAKMTVARNAHARSWRSSPVFITATVGVGFFCRASLVPSLLACFYLVSFWKRKRRNQMKNEKWKFTIQAERRLTER